METREEARADLETVEAGVVEEARAEHISMGQLQERSTNKVLGGSWGQKMTSTGEHVCFEGCYYGY
jgi:hypothetical protein